MKSSQDVAGTLDVPNVVFTRWDQLPGQIPLKYSYDTNMQYLYRYQICNINLKRLFANVVRRILGVV